MKKLFGIVLFWGLMASATAQARHYHINYGFYRGVAFAWGWYAPYRYVWAPTYSPWGYSYVGLNGYQPRNNRFGAISYDAQTGRIGYSYDYTSKWQAVQASNRFCAAEGCRAVVWVQGGCAAIAKEENSERVAWAWDASRLQARKRALQACQHAGGDKCEALAWVCTR